MRNEKLYEITGTDPLSKRAENARWKMIGRTFRHEDMNPAYSAIQFAHNTITSKEIRGKTGRPRQNLYDTIKNDLKSANLDFDPPRDLAKDEKVWNKMKDINRLNLNKRKSIRLEGLNNGNT